MISEQDIIYKNAEVPETQEATREMRRGKKAMIFGLPREKSAEERRVSLTPEAVKRLVLEGHRVLVQEDAGSGAFFKDNDYSEAGAEVVSSKEEVYQADILLKVSPFTDDEISLLKKNKLVLSAIHLRNMEKSYIQRLASKKITAVAYELIQEKSGYHPLLCAMSEIVGQVIVNIAAYYLAHPNFGNGLLMGNVAGTHPTEVVIVGAGTVAANAARVAAGMGCNVKVFDDTISKLRRLQNIVRHQIYTSVYNLDELDKAVSDADIVIAAKHTENLYSPVIVKESMVQTMKEGSVLIDVSIDQGGCCETSKMTSHKSPVFKKYGVTHYCVPNIASKVPRTASLSISNYLLPMLLDLGELGGIEAFMQNNHDFAKGVYLYNGKLTNEKIGEKFALPSQPIELILPSFLGS